MYYNVQLKAAHDMIVWVFNLSFNLGFISVMCLKLGSLWTLVIVEEQQ